MIRTLLLILISVSSPLLARVLDTNHRLPTPRGLEKDIEFWTKIFSIYDADQCVLHDNENLDVIYFVADIPSHSPARAKEIVERASKKVKATLWKFAKGQPPNHWFEKHVLNGIPAGKRHQKFFREAYQRVRCQRGIKSQFLASLQRSKNYLPMIKEKFRNFGLPLDLAYLPHLESGFNVKAASKAGAKGLWQIMPLTAKPFIHVSKKRDDRLHPEIATTVAARILKNNYRKTRSWPLSVTGYNYGINGILRAMRQLKTSDYMEIRRRHESPIFKFAAKNFYPSFLAVRNLAADYENLQRESGAEGPVVAQKERPPKRRGN